MIRFDAGVEIIDADHVGKIVAHGDAVARGAFRRLVADADGGRATAEAARSPSFTTVLLAIKPPWTLENAIPQQALVMTTLLVTVR